MHTPAWVFAVGFLAQGLFSARLLVQWIASERMKRVMTPELFWQLSLLASFLMFTYGWLRDDFAIMLGQSIGYFIYIRNMQLQHSWERLPRTVRAFILLFPAAVLYLGFHNGRLDLHRLFFNEAIPPWLLIWGSVAQVLFTLRFVYQWLLSERIKHSHLPLGFWILSLAGATMILVYAVLRRDPVLFFGHGMGFVVYARNIVLHHRQRRERVHGD
ncbi:lipid-A-disaccharide synthase N-terminal domain-containing protein [Nitratifractor sp.]